jgi:hypothetical protein
MKTSHLKLVKSTVMRPVSSKGRKPNHAYRVREHLTENEVLKLLALINLSWDSHSISGPHPNSTAPLKGRHGTRLRSGAAYAHARQSY